MGSNAGDDLGDRDAWLQQALRHAPDAEAAPPAAVREAILARARSKAPSPSPRGRLVAFLDLLGRPPAAAAFGLLAVSTVLGVLWSSGALQPGADPRPDALRQSEVAPPRAVEKRADTGPGETAERERPAASGTPVSGDAPRADAGQRPPAPAMRLPTDSPRAAGAQRQQAPATPPPTDPRPAAAEQRPQAPATPPRTDSRPAAAERRPQARAIPPTTEASRAEQPPQALAMPPSSDSPRAAAERRPREPAMDAGASPPSRPLPSEERAAELRMEQLPRPAPPPAAPRGAGPTSTPPAPPAPAEPPDAGPTPAATPAATPAPAVAARGERPPTPLRDDAAASRRLRAGEPAAALAPAAPQAAGAAASDPLAAIARQLSDRGTALRWSWAGTARPHDARTQAWFDALRAATAGRWQRLPAAVASVDAGGTPRMQLLEANRPVVQWHLHADRALMLDPHGDAWQARWSHDDARRLRALADAW